MNHQGRNSFVQFSTKKKTGQSTPIWNVSLHDFGVENTHACMGNVELRFDSWTHMDVVSVFTFPPPNTLAREVATIHIVCNKIV